MPPTALLLAALLLLFLGLWLLIRSRALRRRTGLPTGRVTYVDTGASDRCERPLFSRTHRLTGKPDYLVRHKGSLVPVEIKSSTAPDRPYPDHVMQLAAYCLLVEEQEGHAPTHGILQYRDRAFEIDYTPALRSELLVVLDQMRRDLGAHDVERSHDDAGRCRSCGYRDRCDRALA